MMGGGVAGLAPRKTLASDARTPVASDVEMCVQASTCAWTRDRGPQVSCASMDKRVAGIAVHRPAPKRMCRPWRTDVPTSLVGTDSDAGRTVTTQFESLLSS